MLYYIFNEFSMLGIYIFFHHSFGSRLKKKKDFILYLRSNWYFGINISYFHEFYKISNQTKHKNSYISGHPDYYTSYS